MNSKAKAYMNDITAQTSDQPNLNLAKKTQFSPRSCIWPETGRTVWDWAMAHSSCNCKPSVHGQWQSAY